MLAGAAAGGKKIGAAGRDSKNTKIAPKLLSFGEKVCAWGRPLVFCKR